MISLVYLFYVAYKQLVLWNFFALFWNNFLLRRVSSTCIILITSQRADHLELLRSFSYTGWSYLDMFCTVCLWSDFSRFVLTHRPYRFKYLHSLESPFPIRASFSRDFSMSHSSIPVCILVVIAICLLLGASAFIHASICFWPPSSRISSSANWSHRVFEICSSFRHEMVFIKYYEAAAHAFHCWADCCLSAFSNTLLLGKCTLPSDLRYMPFQKLQGSRWTNIID